MTKKKLILLFIPLTIFMLFLVGCEINQTKSNGGSESSPPDQPAHGEATINLMEREVFIGDKLNASFISWLEAYCKAGPTKLIIADMPLVPGQFTRSIAPGFWASQMYALASTYAGVGWTPPEDPDAAYYWTIQDQIYAWWARYIDAIRIIMEKAPNTTALIIINDEPDLVGARLGVAIQGNLASVSNRVELGDVLWDWRKTRTRK